MNEIQRLRQIQPLLCKQLQRGFEHGRPAHAYLFEGDTGTGKQEFGLWMAKHVLCTNLVNQQPYNECHNYVQINENEHPDALRIASDGQAIEVSQIRESKAEFSKSGVGTVKKVFLIQEADRMSTGAANSLLRFLEEPEGQVLAILKTTSFSRVLPTIQSRCQTLHFQPLVKKTLIDRLIKQEIGEKTATLLTELTNSFEEVAGISQDEWFNEAGETILQQFNYLKSNDLQAFIYVQKKTVKAFKEKEQQALSFDLLMVYYRQLLEGSIATQQTKKVTEEQAERLALILKARQERIANVGWQDVYEQLVIQVIHPKP